MTDRGQHHSPDQLLSILHGTIISLVRNDAPDLTARQLAVLLTVYLSEGRHTVRGLAQVLNVRRPVITRALDRFEELGLAARLPDPLDKRSILVGRTDKGAALLGDLRQMAADADKLTTDPLCAEC